MLRLTILIILAILHTAASHAAGVIHDIRISENTERTRIVFDFSKKTDIKHFQLQNPPRMVIDMHDMVWHAPKPLLDRYKTLLGIRYDEKPEGFTRVVLDLAYEGAFKSIQWLPATKEHRHIRAIVDITVAPAEQPQPVAEQKTEIIPVPQLKAPRKRVIVIDAGHGGKDPGAISKRRIQEKSITLFYAQALRDALNKTGKYHVVMTRNGDYYITLRNRVKKARTVQADLFISLHADMHQNRKVQGLSIYTLSERASDKEAAALAKKENQISLKHEFDFLQEEEEITPILIDLVQRDTKNISSHFAETLVATLGGEIRLLTRPHRFAGFRVLTAPDVPSVLIELGYLSNRTEEKRLRSKKHREKVIKGMVTAIEKHMRRYTNPT